MLRADECVYEYAGRNKTLILRVFAPDGADALIGLSNHSPKITPKEILGGPNDEVGLHNSRFN